MTRLSGSGVDIREYGASKGDELNTLPIQEALDDCAKGGDTVYIPSGTFHTGPLQIGDNTTLYLEQGAVLRFVQDFREFPTVESRWEGWDQDGFHPCLFVRDAADVLITGHGTIDGQGSYWWDLVATPDDEYPESLRERLDTIRHGYTQDEVSTFTVRPPLLQIYGCENVTLSGVHLRNSPFWNTHIVYSENVTVHDVNVENPPNAPNGDGIDIDSSRFVRISDVFIDAGDDAICLKSGKDREGRRVGKPAENITITNCTVKHGHGGIVIGSETAGDIRNVVVTNCTFTDTDRGIRIKTKRGRGGIVEDIRFDTIVMRRIACPFVINGYYQTDIDSDAEPVDESTPMVRNIHFQHITAREVESAGFLAGLPEHHFEEISFTDVDIEATRPLDATDLSPAMAENYQQSHGIFCKSVGDISFVDVQVETTDGAALVARKTDSLTIDRFEVPEAQPAPTVDVRDVEQTRISRCTPRVIDGAFIRVSGDIPQRVLLSGNYSDFADQIDIASDASNVVVETR